MRRPTIGLAVEFNRAVRDDDEWFDEPDDLDRVERALAAIDEVDDPVEAAAVIAYRVARAQGFTEGNKRTALLLAKWLLDRNGLDGERFIPPDDRVLADLLVRAASKLDVEGEAIELLRSRR
ncbi:MAG: Fic/DOC family [Actinomycetota bacterium]|nr:Fic/DOC family [Actinomycetota bacterium]